MRTRIQRSTRQKLAELYNTPPDLLEAGFATPRAREMWGERTTATTPESIAIEDIGWTRLNDGNDRYGREMDLGSRDRLIRYLQSLYYQNGYARALTDIPRYYALGEGLNFDIPDEAEADTWEAFWLDPDNSFRTDIAAMFLEWELFGELLLPVFVSPAGRVRLGYIHPTRIKRLATAENNDRIVDRVICRAVNPGLPDMEFQVVRPNGDEAPYRLSGDKGRLYYPYLVAEKGQAFYFRRNGMMTGRGRPSLEALIDWLPTLDDALFDAIRRLRFQGADIYDVTCTGLQETELKRRAEEIQANPPSPGSVRVHNENEQWNTLAPNIGSREVAETATQVKRYIGVGATIPDHLIGASDDVNRNTASEANSPFHRRMLETQQAWMRVWETMFDYVIDAAGYAGRLPMDSPHDLTITATDFEPEDNQAKATAAKTMAEAVIAMMTADPVCIDRDEAVRLFFQAAGDNVPDGYLEKLDALQQQRDSAQEERQAKRLREFVAQQKGGNGNGNGQQQLALPVGIGDENGD